MTKRSRRMINCAKRPLSIASLLYNCSVTFDMFGRNANYHICEPSREPIIPSNTNHANVSLISRFSAFRRSPVSLAADRRDRQRDRSESRVRPDRQNLLKR